MVLHPDLLMTTAEGLIVPALLILSAGIHVRWIVVAFGVPSALSGYPWLLAKLRLGWGRPHLILANESQIHRRHVVVVVVAKIKSRRVVVLVPRRRHHYCVVVVALRVPERTRLVRLHHVSYLKAPFRRPLATTRLATCRRRRQKEEDSLSFSFVIALLNGCIQEQGRQK